MAVKEMDLGRVKGTSLHSGMAITGDSVTSKVYPSSGVDYALENDIYINMDTGDIYKCTIEGKPDAAQWSYAGCLRGKDLTISGVTAGSGLNEAIDGDVKTLSIDVARIRDLIMPIGRQVRAKGASPASLVGGTWDVSSTHGFEGVNIYTRLS